MFKDFIKFTYWTSIIIGVLVAAMYMISSDDKGFTNPFAYVLMIVAAWNACISLGIFNPVDPMIKKYKK